MNEQLTRRRSSLGTRAAICTAVLLSMLAVPGIAGPAKTTPRLFQEKWIDGTGPDEPETQIQALDGDTFVIRQSVKTNFEAPFLYLLFGKDRVLLVDSGAGGLKIRPVVDRIVENWLAKHGRSSIPLVVAHSHAHGDHIAGDTEFRDRADTVVVGLRPTDVAKFFQVRRWPDDTGSIDLGGRRLNVIPTPGHQIAHAMFYDPRLKLLFSGDAIYPGRLYVPVNHVAEARASIDRVALFMRTHPIRALLGAHIEMTSAAGADYAQAAPTHPDEHRLELPPSVIAELRAGLRQKLDIPEQPQVHKDFILYPVPPRAE